ncbi:GNAT family N-acetyltransferase [Embleya scabrispora]|uniref:GNAT family N-acetyltransferase n=1 Tax=Embleya scabrispora TaxID=159449 RepID=UPI000377B8B5|nr:GNAT family N-acetyltransferase [Embleya scabrispora]MYS81288.1 GNAT family N-acetyltransferase [Streptomyces sp. SID5474]
MTMTIRPATARDLPGLLALYAEFHPDDVPLPVEDAYLIWADIATQRGRTVLVADLDGDVVGTADCAVLPNLTRGGRPIMFVENVVVAATRRRQGTGRRLLAAAGTLAADAGCYKLQLLAADSAEAHEFYRACGFESRAQGFRRYLRPVSSTTP